MGKTRVVYRRLPRGKVVQSDGDTIVIDGAKLKEIKRKVKARKGGEQE